MVKIKAKNNQNQEVQWENKTHIIHGQVVYHHRENIQIYSFKKIVTTKEHIIKMITNKGIIVKK